MKLLPILLVCLSALSANAHAPARTLYVEGSDTMLPLMDRLAEGFSKAQKEIRVSVRGGGTRLGLQAFASRAAEIAAASRRYTVDEVSEMRSAGRETYETPIALDGLAIAVREDNPITSISLADLRRIYLGQVRNWKELGGSDEAILPLSRDTNSGTHDFFRLQILRDQEWGLGVRFVVSTGEEVRQLLKIPGAIAYGGIAYFRDVKGTKLLKVSAQPDSEAYLPDEDHVRNRKYPIWRHLFVYTDGKPRGDVKKFVDFALSSEGQALVDSVGYYRLKP